MTKREYQREVDRTKEARMAWWREARFGMFVHFGLYAQLGRGEWAQAHEDIDRDEYAKLADTFNPRPGAPREWAALAKAAGMKYMVLTTRHHEGFSLWDSKANPFNSVNYGPHRDIVREYVDACREFGLKVGFYSSLMDWHHPDGFKAGYDNAARERFLQYIYDINIELMTNYGQIDMLWYDCPAPMNSWEGWDTLRRDAKIRELQPGIIINGRAGLDEDFGTPEGEIVAGNADWEACMTFNGFSWGYVDETQALPHAHTPMSIVKMLQSCASQGGNLLLNIGPAADGSVPKDAIEPLTQVGKWLEKNGDAVYGRLRRRKPNSLYDFRGNAVTMATASEKHVYLWNYIWPKDGSMGIAGYLRRPKSIRLLADGTPLDFEYERGRIRLVNLPREIPDKLLGLTIIDVEFDETPQYLDNGSYNGYLLNSDHRFFELTGMEPNK